MSMEQEAVRGVPWTILTYAGNKLVTLVTTVILARLLTPEDFGLVALAYVAILALTVYRDAGVGSALIVRESLDEADKRTTLTLIVAISVISAAAIAAASSQIAGLLGEPRLTAVLAALTLSIVFGAPAWFYDALMQRELEFRKRFLALSAQNVVYPPVAITLAVLGAGVWSLVIGYVVGAAASAAAFIALSPYWVRPGFDLARARTALRLGAAFMFQGGLAFLRENVDYLAIGRILGAAPLGAYSLAYRLADVPYRAIAEPVARVTFPGFARMRARGDDVTGSFLSVLRLVAITACPLGVIASAVAAPFVEAVLGDRWLAAIGPLAVLGLWAAVRSVAATLAWLLNSLGHAPALAKISAAILVPFVPAVVVAAHLGGAAAVAAVVVGDVLIEGIAIALFTDRRVGIGVGRLWRALRPVAFACVPTWLAARGVAASIDLVPVVDLAASTTIGLATYALVLNVLEPGVLREALRQVVRTIRRTPSAS